MCSNLGHLYKPDLSLVLLVQLGSMQTTFRWVHFGHHHLKIIVSSLKYLCMMPSRVNTMIIGNMPTILGKSSRNHLLSRLLQV
jgi:hypothetical protein